MHPADTLKPGMFAEDAPSRPPSRVSQAVVDQPDREPSVAMADGHFGLTGTLQMQINPSTLTPTRN